MIEKLSMMAIPTNFLLTSKAKILQSYLSLPRKSMRTKCKWWRKEKRKRPKKSMISLIKGQKVMLAQKQVFLAYPSEFSPSFQKASLYRSSRLVFSLKWLPRCFSRTLKGISPLRGIEHQIDFIQGSSLLRMSKKSVPVGIRG